MPSDSTTKDGTEDDSNWRDLHGGLIAKMRLEKLHEALKCLEKELLEKAIAEAYQAGVNPKHYLLYQAETELDILNVKDELHNAVSSKNPEEIRATIYKITNNRLYHSRLQHDVTEALRDLGQIERVLKIGSNIMDMDRKTIAEIRRYHHPPSLVHEVMKAVLLLFKENEEITEKWSVCQQHLQPNGPNGMNRKILDFDPSSVQPEIAARVYEILKGIELRKLQEVSSGAATFYTKGVVDVLLTKGGADKVQPADVKRQKEIFSPTPPSPQRKRKQYLRDAGLNSPRKNLLE